jgi:hypothetical protein
VAPATRPCCASSRRSICRGRGRKSGRCTAQRGRVLSPSHPLLHLAASLSESACHRPGE